MKKILLFLVLTTSGVAMAQETTDTTFVVNGKTIKVSDNNGKTVINVFRQDGEMLSKTTQYSYSDSQEVEQIYVSTPLIPAILKQGERRKRFKAQWPFFYLGRSMGVASAFDFNGNPAMHSRDSKSWEWGITLGSAAIPLNKAKTFGIVAGLQVGQVHHHFKNNYALFTDDNHSFMAPVEDIELKKSYISYNVLRLALMLQTERYNFFAGIGASLEYRENEHSRYIKRGGGKTTLSDDININPFGVNLDMKIGYGGFSLYMRGAITPLLNKDVAPKCFPLTIGMGIGL